MERASQSKGTAFWWRAAEPIPARPLALEPRPDDADTEIVPGATIEPERHGARRASHAPAPAANQGRSSAALVATPALEGAPPPRRPLRFVARPERRSNVGGYRGSHIAAAAAVAGALLFAGLSGFGAKVRGAPPLLNQAEAWAIAAGFGINEISVAGLKHTGDADVFRALGAPESTLAGLDVAAARRRIEALPWVETATLVRILPDRLRIEIRERRASAVWLHGERRSLVDATGRLLGHLGTFVPPDLPRIAGEGAPEAAAELFAALGQHVGLRSQVVLAHRIGGRRWDLELASGSRVKLAATDPSASLARLVALQQTTLQQVALQQRGITDDGRPNEASLLDRPDQIIDLTLDGHIVIGTGAADRNADRQAAVGADPAKPL